MRFLERHKSPVLQISFSANGLLFGSVAASEPIRIWRTSDNWKFVEYPKVEPNKIESLFRCMAFPSKLPDCIVVGRTDGGVDIISLWEPQLVNRLPAAYPTFVVTSVAFLNNDRYLAVTCGDRDDTGGMTRVYNREKNYQMVRELSAGSFMCGLTVRPNTKTCYYIEGLRRVRKCDLLKSDQMQSAAYSKPIRELAINSTGTMLAVAHDYAIDILDADTLQRQKTLSGHKGRVDSLAFLLDGRLLSGSWDKTVRLWDVDSGRELSAHDWDIGGVRSVAVSPDGFLAAAGGDSGAIVLWDLDE